MSSHRCKFSKIYIFCWKYGWGILTELFRRYIPTKLETKLCPSVKFTDKKIPTIISLVFANFLVVVGGLASSHKDSSIFIVYKKWALSMVGVKGSTYLLSMMVLSLSSQHDECSWWIEGGNCLLNILPSAGDYQKVVC